MDRKRAFTLIELLVVIAIIAILAAILFPVFAQAKLSAKFAASISNDKQICLAEIMYGTDYDDKVVPDMDWGNRYTDMLGWRWDFGECYAPWGWLMLPYVKTAEIYQDPTTTKQPLGWDSYPVTYSEFPQFGYNYSELSPSTSQAQKWEYVMDVRNTVSHTAVAQPASTVMFVSKAEWEKGDRAWWFYGMGTRWIGRAAVEPPDCAAAVGWCETNWGTGSWFSQIPMASNAANGAFTGATCFRKAGQAVVGWVDGHVTGMTAGALTAGTNWNQNIVYSDLIQTNNSKYLWDTK